MRHILFKREALRRIRRNERPMTILIIGGAASGKSAYAEALAVRLSRTEERVYIATMRPEGRESRQRIRKHRAMRAGKGFRTVECYVDLENTAVGNAQATVLLECMGNLCANEVFERNSDAETIARGVESMRAECRNLIVVSNEIFSGGDRYGEDTLRYLRIMAEVNRQIAASVDVVCEVVCGIPHFCKGGELIGRI